ncbi:MAG: shikimate dehydrogenase [Nitrospiraceae bacterium]|nr:shikimate dehydrogenase [Nitrospiraceae bacterium]
MKITARTKLLALFGHPAGHSLSPDMHNAAFEQMGLDYCYLALEVKPGDLPDAVRAVRAFGMRGVNITVPHKEKVIPLLDEIDEEAAFIGAVNTIVNTDGRLKGHNTDGRGFMRLLDEEGVDVSGKNVFVCGAGGGSRAISYYLSEKAASLRIFDLDGDKLEKLVSDLGRIRNNVRTAPGGVKDMVVKDMGGVDLFINATPLGLKQTDPMPADPSAFPPGTVVGDLIYRETPLLREAKKAGLKTFNGLGMLLWQGVLASELWTGVRPPHEVMRSALLRNF